MKRTITVTFSDMPAQKTIKEFPTLADAKRWTMRQMVNSAQWQQLVNAGSLSLLCRARINGNPDVTMTVILD